MVCICILNSLLAGFGRSGPIGNSLVKSFQREELSSEDSFSLAADDYLHESITKPSSVSMSQSKIDSMFQSESVNFYYPSSVFKSITIEDKTPKALTSRQLGQIAHSFLMYELDLQPLELSIVRQFTDSMSITHVYTNRVINGVPVSNNNAAAHIKNGQVVSYSASFASDHSQVIPEAKVGTSLQDAIKNAEKILDAPQDTFKPFFSYLETSNGELAYTYNFQVRDDHKDIWSAVSVDASSGEIVETVNYYKKASFKAIQLPNIVPTSGFTMVVNPEDSFASPLGWNNDGSTIYSSTTGNNIDVFVNNLRGYRPQSDPNLVFDSQWNPTEDPYSAANVKASSTHLFYLMNVMHDVSYHYGFTEASGKSFLIKGNFQQSNLGRPAKLDTDRDRVNVNNLNNRGKDNANMATPPDGQSPRMNMYIFDITRPHRDGSLDSAIPIHEFTHGITNRLTGGADNYRCLNNVESAGLGEGWSDIMALFLARNAQNTRYEDIVIGAYVLGDFGIGRGIRRFPYSTKTRTNSLKFSTLIELNEVHAVGEVWAVVINEMYWNLVDQSGFSQNWLDRTQSQGNIVAMNLVMGALMLQPCNPNFLQARDAIVQADINYYNGAHLCEIWIAFAKRGMGFDASRATLADGYTLPPGVCNKRHPAKL